MNRTHVLAFCLGPVLASTVACTVVKPIPNTAVDYNRAVQKAENRTLLLNILRASERRPKAFTSISSFNGLATSGATPAVSLGLANDASDGLSLSLPFGGGTAAFTVGVDHSKEFTQGIVRPVDMGQVAYFWVQGWPKAMVALLLLERLEITYPTAEEAAEIVTRLDPLSSAAGCPLHLARHRRETALVHRDGSPTSAVTFIYENRPSDEFEDVHDFECLIRLLLDLQAIDLGMDPSPVTPSVTIDDLGGLEKALQLQEERGLVLEKGDDGRYHFLDPTPRFRFSFGGPSSASASTSRTRDVQFLNDEGSRVRGVIRSVEAVIHYLGQIVRHQDDDDPLRVRVYDASDSKPCGQVRTWDDARESVMHPDGCATEARLFTVLPKRLSQRDAIATVRHQGTTYSVPLSRVVGEGDLSGTVLSCLDQLLGLNRAASSSPPSGVVLVGVGK